MSTRTTPSATTPIRELTPYPGAPFATPGDHTAAAITAATLRDSFKWLDRNHDGFLDLFESRLTPLAFAQLEINRDELLDIAELLQASASPAGIASLVYVDCHYAGWEDGSAARPFNSLLEAANFVAPGGVIAIAPDNTNESVRISGPMTIVRNAAASAAPGP